ncbi:mechanosensitive ion channel family protein [Metabacillus fastidiosus]|nr:mechanosensitive ion channel family protein [Metabacillus fastidiosus]MED4453895.1 mechanosensitive ion channel family protein [Metabacillus fastidiosus]MED4460654.1 mechanosensitive ion channel family protein [Metabacillus fastidiosus]
MRVAETFWIQFYEKVTQPELWIMIGQGAFKIFLIVIVSSIVIRIGKIAIQKIFLLRMKSPLNYSERREATLLRLLQNVLRYVIYFNAIIMILETLTFKVGALLAGAGIAGLAIGFGAQNLVRDIITGFFIIFEDQFSVGDYVKIGNLEGTVEEIGLRTVKFKSWTGEVHIIPNGNIVEVTNYSVHNSVAYVDVSIAYGENIERVENIIKEVLEEMTDKYEEIVKPPELLGVQMLGTSEIVLRVTCEVKPRQNFYIARELRKEIKTRLDENGVDIPYPRMVMYSKEEVRSSN